MPIILEQSHAEKHAQKAKEKSARAFGNRASKNSITQADIMRTKVDAERALRKEQKQTREAEQATPASNASGEAASSAPHAVTHSGLGGLANLAKLAGATDIDYTQLRNSEKTPNAFDVADMPKASDVSNVADMPDASDVVDASNQPNIEEQTSADFAVGGEADLAGDTPLIGVPDDTAEVKAFEEVKAVQGANPTKKVRQRLSLASKETTEPTKQEDSTEAAHTPTKEKTKGHTKRHTQVKEKAITNEVSPDTNEVDAECDEALISLSSILNLPLLCAIASPILMGFSYFIVTKLLTTLIGG